MGLECNSIQVEQKNGAKHHIQSIFKKRTKKTRNELKQIKNKSKTSQKRIKTIQKRIKNEFQSCATEPPTWTKK